MPYYMHLPRFWERALIRRGPAELCALKFTVVLGWVNGIGMIP
jgi:hypothetical protein